MVSAKELLEGKKEKDKPKVSHKSTKNIVVKSDQDLIIIALNYAINTIRNKSEVKEKKGTYYHYFTRWTEIYNKLTKKGEDLENVK